MPLSPGDTLLFVMQPREENRDLRSGLETPLQPMFPAWVSSVPTLAVGSSARLADALLFSGYLPARSCHLLSAQACLLAGDIPSGSPSSSRHACILWESPPLGSHPCALCPFSNGRGSLAAETLYFFGCPFTVSDPIPTIPWGPRASSCHLHAVFLCRLFLIQVLGERRTEEVHKPQQTTSHFYFPYCRVLCRALIKPRSPRSVSVFCISTTTFLHITGNTKLEHIFATC